MSAFEFESFKEHIIHAPSSARRNKPGGFKVGGCDEADIVKFLTHQSHLVRIKSNVLEKLLKILMVALFLFVLNWGVELAENAELIPQIPTTHQSD